jgi:hypothetical protein
VDLEIEVTAPQSSDARLAKEVAAYWTRLAYESIIAFTRAQQAERGYSQPQFWLLRRLSTQDLAADDEGRTLPEPAHAMADYLREEDDLESESGTLVRRGWLVRVGQRLKITDLGEQARVTIGSHAPEIRALIHQGIDDADHATTIKVLQRLIRNTRPRS